MTASLASKFALGVLCATIGMPSAALACGSLPVILCKPGAFSPSTATLPANAVQWLWTRPFEPGPADTDASVVRPRLYLLADGQRSELPVSETAVSEYQALLAPMSELAVGSELEIGYAYRCYAETEQIRARLTVASAAPRPTTLGTLVPGAKIAEITVGLCGETINASYVDLRVALSSDATPYRDGFRNTLKIDGKLATPLNHQFPGIEEILPAPGFGGVVRVFARCGQPNELADLPLGRHRVQVIGSLQDGSAVESEEREIELRCDPPTDAGAVDAGPAPVLPRDAGTTADASVGVMFDAGSPRPSAPADDGCALGTGRGASWLALALGLLLARRKRA